ncbi:MAG: hypothetical protein IJB83_01760 [Bacilli bacterium]|nr:hypothetical protein [Bacilli bacterium]
MKEDINNYSDYKDSSELKEKIDELKKEKRKYNFKKALITLRYTLPTISYFALTLGASQLVSTKWAPMQKYEHIESELKKGSTPKISEPFYSENKEGHSNLIFKMPPYLSPDTDKYSRVVYTYNLNNIDINSLENWIQKNDYSDIQNALKLLPKPVVSVEECDYENNENYEVIIKIDSVNIDKKITSKDYFTFYGICFLILCFYALYQIGNRCDYHQYPYKGAKFFPKSLINALDAHKCSEKSTNIKGLEKEIEELVLKLNK